MRVQCKKKPTLSVQQIQVTAITAARECAGIKVLGQENAPKIEKTISNIYDSNTKLAEKMDSILRQTAGDVGQELLKTVPPLGSKPPLEFERDKNVPDPLQITNCKRDTVSSETLQCNKSLCEQLAKIALAAGSRDNITVLIVLLNGCGKIPNDLNN